MRTLSGKDIASGTKLVTDDYGTYGPASTFHIKNDVPTMPKSACYILDPQHTCSVEEIASLVNGIAVIKDYFVVGVERTSVNDAPIKYPQKVLGA